MQVVNAAADFQAGNRRVCAAIGVFDGVHPGHQHVIGRALEEARAGGDAAVVVTFDRHPNAIVAPQNVPPMIYPLSKKLRLLEAMGLDGVYVIRFDKVCSEIPGREFICGLARDFKGLRVIVVGEDFKFGHKRSGNVALLNALGAKLDFAVRAVPDVSAEGLPVSSTRIREAVSAGNFALAAILLGRVYTLCGRIISGQRLGAKLGCPTANVDVTGMLLPPTGVYAASAMVRGKTHRAAVNIGRRPTVESGPAAITVEAHLLGFSGDIYGEEMELEFLARLRGEQKFDSLDSLRNQIQRDTEAAKAV